MRCLPFPFSWLARTGLLAVQVGALLRTLREVPLRPGRWRTEVAQRFGFGLSAAPRSLWVHGEGMGEFLAAEPLIASLAAEDPGRSLVLTTSRPDIADWLAGRHPGAICLPHPFDLAGAARRFFDRLRPERILLLEFHDGFCPAALARAWAAGVPVVVVNGRCLPANCPLRYRVSRDIGLTRHMAGLVTRFLVQDGITRRALLELGVDAGRVAVTGNLKYDRALDSAQVGAGAMLAGTVLVAGCIHADEEALLVRTFAALRHSHPSLRMIVAPHDPARAAALGVRLTEAGYLWKARSAGGDTDVVILDRRGELGAAYARAAVAIIGGSFLPGHAGHSLAEAAAHGVALVTGPYTSSQADMVQAFRDHDAVLQVEQGGLAEAIDHLLNDTGTRRRLGDRARSVVVRNAGATARTLAELPPAVDRPRAGWKRLARAAVFSPAGQVLLSLAGRRVVSLDELRHRLGSPRTILCLGNGPSSEDPRLTQVAHDCLFRVNWRWRERGFLPDPDVIFTGDPETVRRCPGRLYAFRTREEQTLCLARAAFRWWRGRVEHVTLDRLPLRLADGDWPARPTNGAAMVSTAAALRPDRLIIAGIDLFAHPAGGYPGDATVPNRYAPVHDRAVEVAILRQALKGFPGQLTVFGDSLATALGRSLPVAA